MASSIGKPLKENSITHYGREYFLSDILVYDPMCQTVLQQRCSSAVPAVLPALLQHTVLKNAECSTATVLHYCCVLRSMNGTWRCKTSGGILSTVLFKNIFANS
jgi:hypothetical protein